MPAKRDKSTLTPLQQRFAEEYIKDLNATAAYKRSGYKVKNDNIAASSAWALLRNPKVQEVIRNAANKLSESVQVDAKKVLTEYIRVAESDLADLFDESGTLKPIREIPLAARRAISSVKVRRVKERGAEPEEIIEVKLWDKMKALDSLAKHLNLFDERTPLEKLLECLPEGLRRQLGEALRVYAAGK